MMKLLIRLWPGLPGLFQYGRWSFLIVALFFALVLDGFLFLNFFWSEYITPTQRNVGLGVLFLVWLFLGMIANQRMKFFENMRHSDSKSQKYNEAIVHYLQGNWFETEFTLKTILRKNPADIDALLMLATLYRHTKRPEEAIQTLLLLKKLEESRKWYVEIETEWARLRQPAPPVSTSNAQSAVSDVSAPESPSPENRQQPVSLSTPSSISLLHET
jgi:tetratricopeptide (TPR) repeat protein